ncbi:hypothetical protein E2493_06145 [Sphingomonas parva]|uniref:Uncharacterized protein n=2 Tax=Sphingomonas parva TaxID=2555898 RepID=A0A4Y8ZWU4_9SPHN|nr:hypothetical protein E2493_06145 [Sphingomonas parva]
MSPGFVVDQGYGSVSVSTWQEGEPRKSFWTGVKQRKDAQREIVTWCCDRCGYLESYAAEG